MVGLRWWERSNSIWVKGPEVVGPHSPKGPEVGGLRWWRT